MRKINLKGMIIKCIKAIQPINVSVNNVVLAPNELLSGKKAIVTGAGSGIGKAIAKAFVNSGATVVGIGRDIKKLNMVETELGCEKFLPYCCDVSKVDEIPTYLSQILTLLEGDCIDILVNCAGVKNGNDERFFDYTPEEFDYVINTNLKGMFFWCQHVSKYMIERKIKGHIINVISIKGFIGEASPYSVSKWGGVSLTKGLARKLAPEGIVVNGIAPGGTKTDMANIKDRSMLHLATPNMRLADPNEMANIAVFLASDLGSNIVGEIIISDGGQVLQYGNGRI